MTRRRRSDEIEKVNLTLSEHRRVSQQKARYRSDNAELLSKIRELAADIDQIASELQSVVDHKVEE